ATFAGRPGPAARLRLAPCQVFAQRERLPRRAAVGAGLAAGLAGVTVLVHPTQLIVPPAQVQPPLARRRTEKPGFPPIPPCTPARLRLNRPRTVQADRPALW